MTPQGSAHLYLTKVLLVLKGFRAPSTGPLLFQKEDKKVMTLLSKGFNSSANELEMQCKYR